MSARTSAAAVALAAALLLARPAAASAHVYVFPDRVTPGTFTLFSVISPDEKTSPLTGLTLNIPPDLIVSAVQPAAGFRTQIVRDQTLRVIGLRWTGGHVPPGQMAVFQFTALPPSGDATITIPAVQTFADGSTEVWHSASLTVGPAPSGGGGSSALSIVALVVAFYAGVTATIAAIIVFRLSRRPH